VEVRRHGALEVRCRRVDGGIELWSFEAWIHDAAEGVLEVWRPGGVGVLTQRYAKHEVLEARSMCIDMGA